MISLDLARGVVAEQPQVTRDLLDRVVNRLFQVGLNVQAASGLPADVLRARLAEALDQLDDAILQIRNYAFGRRSGSVRDGVVVELSRHLEEEIADGRDGDPVQDGPVDGLAQRPERRPVGAGQRQHRAGARRGKGEVGVQHREQPAARRRWPPSAPPARPICSSRTTRGPAPGPAWKRRHADPGQARAVGPCRGGQQRIVFAEPQQPLSRHGEADVQAHLIANEHPPISPAREPARKGRWSLADRVQPTGASPGR